MAYNRWLSSQYSYNSNYDLMHYGRKGMKWGKHVFGLPDINIFSNGTTFNTESLRKLLERGQIDYNRFKELTKQAARNVSDTWDNFRAGESADKRPERRTYSSWDSNEDKAKYSRTDDHEVKRQRKHPDLPTTWEMDKEYQKNRDSLRKKAAEEKRSKADKARVEDKIKQHEKQGRKDNMDEANRKKLLEQKRKERESKAKVNSKSTIQNDSKTENPSSVTGYPTGKNSPSAEELLLLALGASAAQSEEEKKKRDKERDEKFNKEVEAYQKEQAAKQKKIYEAIGKFLNFAIKVLPGSGAYELAKKLKKK